MFGGSKKSGVKEEVVQTLSENLNAQLAVYKNMRILLPAIQADPYIAGYIYGKIISYISYAIKFMNLPPNDANMVSGLVLINVFGETDVRDVSEQIRFNLSIEDPAFKDAELKGSTIIAYTVGAREIESDPNYDEAIKAFHEQSRGIEGAPHTDDRFAAIAGLEQLWFGSKMEAHF